MKKYHQLILLLAWFLCMPGTASPKQAAFIHPGIDQSKADMAYMKKQVLAGTQPWKDAFDRLLKSVDTAFQARPATHVLRGPYGRPNIGGDALSRSSEMAYNCALAGFITGNRVYSDKAIQIIGAWTPVLWHFDYNDAKLLAGWTGHLLCNAAEILKYTDSGWKKEDQDRFTNMLMTVYYPLIRFYYPQANGNWDGAIIHTVLAIAIFTDNHEMFGNALDHFCHAPVNGSLFKYIYPSGQCQESTRDQGHVQLGLGEFAGAAKVAFTQGVDLFSIGGNRIGLGYEYTAAFLSGKIPFCYGRISDRAKNLRDDYEYVYRHYAARGVDLPYTRMAADSVRPKASRSVLTAFRAPTGEVASKQSTPKPSTIGYPAGALENAITPCPAGAIRVNPGESLQAALDEAAGRNVWVIALRGVHKLPAALKMPSGVTLSGEGLGTILLADPAAGFRETIVNASDDLNNITLCDLVIEGAVSPETPSDPNSVRSYRGAYNRGGIMFLGKQEDAMRNITFRNITVRNCTYHGIYLAGVKNVTIDACNLDENGASVVPGARQLHNLLLSHCSVIAVKNSRMDTSPFGCGISLNSCHNAAINNCEMARNGWTGLLVTESSQIEIKNNLLEANDSDGILLQYLYQGSRDITINGNHFSFNQGFGFSSFAVSNLTTGGNTFEGNGNSLKADQQVSSKQEVIMNDMF